MMQSSKNFDVSQKSQDWFRLANFLKKKKLKNIFKRV